MLYPHPHPSLTTPATAICRSVIRGTYTIALVQPEGEKPVCAGLGGYGQEEDKKHAETDEISSSVLDVLVIYFLGNSSPTSLLSNNQFPV